MLSGVSDFGGLWSWKLMLSLMFRFDVLVWSGVLVVMGGEFDGLLN